MGVEIGHFSGTANEEAFLLLPGLPLVNRPGENPEPDLWTFEVETPDASVAARDSATVMIDYVHPGTLEHRSSMCLSKGEYFHRENENIFTENFVPSQCCYLLKRCVGWNTVFCDGCSPRSSSIDETSTTRGTAASTTSAVTAAVPAVDGPDTH